MDRERVVMRRRPMVPIVLATATIVLVALLGGTTDSATARTHVYRGAAPGQVTCLLSGSLSFSPRISSASGTASHSSRLIGKLSACTTSDGAVRVTSGRMRESFPASPLNCATLSSTGAPATMRVTWKGTLFGGRAKFSETTETNTQSQLVTNGGGLAGFSIPGGGGQSTSSGSFAAGSGSTASAYTPFTPSGLSSMCQRPKGLSKLAVSGTITIGSPTSGIGPSGIALGDYAGTDRLDNLMAFSETTGAALSYVTDYLDKTDGWADMDNADIAGAWAGTGYRLVLGVPILPGTGTLAQGAAGDYNQYFATLATNLVNDGEANAILRLGWEFNGSWFPWYVQTSADAANFVSFWQQIVNTMRSVRGQQFKFLWNASGSTASSYSPAAAYPGNAYVDYVGTDVYDNFWGSPFTPAAAWANQLSEQWGLNWLASFASAHGKPIAIPEWSVEYRPDGHGLGDDPSFIDNMRTWFQLHDVAFADMFSFDTSSSYRNDITDGTFPNSLAEFEKDFG